MEPNPLPERREMLRWGTGAGRPRAPSPPSFPNLPVLTHEGKSVRFYDDLVRGRTVVFNMMYTVCTGVCPISTANLLQVQQALGPRLGRDVFMYSMTLQPQFDDARALRGYMQRYGIQPGWTYLTGKLADMDLLRRELGFVDSDPVADSDLRTHTGMVRAGNDALNRWLMVPAFSSADRIVGAVQRLVVNGQAGDHG